MDDLYISLRLSLMWQYKSSFFHLRSFMENYFQMIVIIQNDDLSLKTMIIP